MASDNGSRLFIPEKTALIELEAAAPSGGRGKYGFIVKAWLNWVREVSRLLLRINATGIQNGVVVTDDTGTALVVANDLEDTTYLATDFTADSGTWVVQLADITTWARNRLGRLLTVVFDLRTTTVTGTPSELRILIPGGFLAQRAITGLCYLGDNGSAVVGVIRVAAGGDKLLITRLDGGAFSSSTDLTDVRGEFVLEVQ